MDLEISSAFSSSYFLGLIIHIHSFLFCVRRYTYLLENIKSFFYSSPKSKFQCIRINSELLLVNSPSGSYPKLFTSSSVLHLSIAKKKNSSRQETPEEAAERLKKEELSRIHAEARQEILQRRILATEEMAANVSPTQLPELVDFNIYTSFSSSIKPLNHLYPVDTFGQFPIEVKLQIFKKLTDIDSLHSLISASRSFHECCIDDKYQCEVFCRILVDEMTLPIFLQAVAMFSNSTGEWTNAFQNVRKFMDQYSTNSRATTFNHRSYNMRTLASIAKFHLTTKAVTQDFFESCLNLHPWTHEKYEKNELGRLEGLRIQRAFYNFELYVHLFKRGDYYVIEQTLLNERLHGIILGVEISGEKFMSRSLIISAFGNSKR
ncbi:uncharacterized protein Bfra_001647 [Botrytis fragariae]|uniref:F-box domain-containing protein n=1 Tax=Botrytis fragariae TaxID=1964551 RepID=A0A8H6B154_9HELO|nr:uncharacterized protein Bfra_001647 [Botrytis fragariae]KAF5877279.1 hypothetical protein Bfra_001647 [Botrytis fragariae]